MGKQLFFDVNPKYVWPRFIEAKLDTEINSVETFSVFLFEPQNNLF